MSYSHSIVKPACHLFVRHDQASLEDQQSVLVQLFEGHEARVRDVPMSQVAGSQGVLEAVVLLGLDDPAEALLGEVLERSRQRFGLLGLLLWGRGFVGWRGAGGRRRRLGVGRSQRYPSRRLVAQLRLVRLAQLGLDDEGVHDRRVDPLDRLQVVVQPVAHDDGVRAHVLPYGSADGLGAHETGAFVLSPAEVAERDARILVVGVP